jgi:leader peptidase (prepilin peptidase)/N-methyltransferase
MIDSTLILLKLILSCILLFISIIDITAKIISNKLIIIGMIIGVIMVFLNDNITIMSSLLGCMICGGIVAVISIITKGSIGMGDAKLFACVGIWFGLQTTLGIMLIATMLSGFVGLILLTFKKVNRKTTMPFAPYVFLATIFVMIFN